MNEKEISMTDAKSQTLPTWPDGTEHPVTADGYARWLTVSAYYRLTAEVPPLLHAWETAGLPKSGPLRDAYVSCISAASAEYGLAYMLREAGGHMSADKLAEGVHEAYDGWTEQVIGYLEDWLIEYGLNPLLVAGLVEKERAVRLDKGVSPGAHPVGVVTLDRAFSGIGDALREAGK